MSTETAKPKVKYEKVTINVSNATANEPITINLSSKDGNIGWSTGEDYSHSTGISLKPSGSGTTIPLSSFSVSSNKIAFTAASAGGSSSSSGASFELGLYISADENVNYFQLSASDGDVTIEIPAGSETQGLTSSEQNYSFD